MLAEVVAGIRRQAGTARRRKQAADDRVLQAMLAAVPATNLKAIRDRALLAFGMTVRFGATNTDPEGRRIRPVALLEAWLEAAGITDGAVFRDVVRGQASAGPISDRTVARVVQRAARAGASLFRLKDVSRHRSTDVLAAYVREAGLFTDHAGKGFL